MADVCRYSEKEICQALVDCGMLAALANPAKQRVVSGMIAQSKGNLKTVLNLILFVEKFKMLRGSVASSGRARLDDAVKVVTKRLRHVRALEVMKLKLSKEKRAAAHVPPEGGDARGPGPAAKRSRCEQAGEGAAGSDPEQAVVNADDDSASSAGVAAGIARERERFFRGEKPQSAWGVAVHKAAALLVFKSAGVVLAPLLRYGQCRWFEDENPQFEKRLSRDDLFRWCLSGDHFQKVMVSMRPFSQGVDHFSQFSKSCGSLNQTTTFACNHNLPCCANLHNLPCRGPAAQIWHDVDCGASRGRRDRLEVPRGLEVGARREEKKVEPLKKKWNP